ncbi:MAG: thioredoxin family protein [Proteobacteria bacterium]|nr:thioredoxin family protein [Pseudomonadota bacterium]
MTARLQRFGAAVLLALACLPSAAADGWEKFFTPSLGDLRAEAADAKAGGKRGVMLMLHFDACPFCKRMKDEVLHRPEVQRHFQKHFASIAIDTRGDLPITGFDGRPLPEKEYARTLGIRGTPSFLFFAPDGTRLYIHAGGLFDPAEFMLLADYVASGAYRSGTFAAYKQNKPKRGS